MPYQLGYATKKTSRHKNAQTAQPETRGQIFVCVLCASLWLILDAATRLELASTRLQDERSRIQLSYAARKCLVDREGFEPSQKVCRTSMLPITSPALDSLVAVSGVEPLTFRL